MKYRATERGWAQEAQLVVRLARAPIVVRYRDVNHDAI